MAGRETEADWLARCRVTFERAQRDGISMEEARQRIALEQIELKRRAIAELRGEDWRHPRSFASDHIQGGAEPRFYWQRGDLA